MNLEIQTPLESLGKPHCKHAPNESRFTDFVLQLKTLINSIDQTESEEYNKNLLKTFLEKSFYEAENFVNTKGR